MKAYVDLDNVRLETKRLILRAFQKNDVNDFYEYAKVEGVGEAAGWSHHQDIDESKRILKLFMEEKKTFAVVYKDNQKVIGSIGLEEVRELDESFDLLRGREIGYVLNKDYWGQGLMSEAVQEVMRYCFEDLQVDFLTCGYFIENKRSKSVNEKMGFDYYKDYIHHTRFHETRDAHMTLMTKEKYFSSKN